MAFVDATDVLEALDTFEERVQDGTLPLSQFDIEVKSEIGLDWTLNAKATGGTVRGEQWDGFSDQYTRKTDGVTVPAWGGVPKVKLKYTSIGRRLSFDTYGNRGGLRGGRHTFRGLRRTTPVLQIELDGYSRGQVQGKKRPSGQRVTESSRLNEDTGRLRNAILTRTPWIRVLFGSTFLRIGNELPIYAYHVLEELDRNPLHWIPDDEDKLRRHVEGWVSAMTVEFNERPSYHIESRFQ